MKLCCERYAFWITLGVSLCAYFNTVSPSIAGGDAGELVAEGCQLGVSHPPGYPLYTIMVHFVTKYVRRIVPNDRSDAWIVNSTSCIFGSVASALLASSIVLLLQGKQGRSFEKVQSKRSTPKYNAPALTTKRVMGVNDLIHVVAGTSMGLLHSFSPLAWQYSITSEVFALHNLFVALILYASICFAQEQSLKYFLSGAFLCGLALTNQHTSILLSVPMILWVIYTTQLYNTKRWIVNVNGKSYNLLLLAAGSFLSSFVFLYSALPIFATLYPHQGSWGEVTSIVGFINHFLRKDYGTLKLFSGNDKDSEGLWQRVFLWANDFIWKQGSPFVASCFIVGCKQIITKEQRRRSGKMQFRSKRQSASRVARGEGGSHLSLDGPNVDIGILVSLIFYILVFHSLANLPLNNELYFGVHQRFWMHPNLISFVIAGLGMSHILKQISVRCSNRMIPLVLIIFPLVLIAISFKQGMRTNDQSDNYHFRNYARSILITLPQNAILFINYDQQWTSIRYLQECEAVRQDITSIHLGMMSYEWWQHKRQLYPEMKFPGTHYIQGNPLQRKNGGFTFSELLDANYSGSNGLFIGGKPTFPDPNYVHGYEEIPYGIVSKIVKKSEKSSPEAFRIESKQVWTKIMHEYAVGLPDITRYGDETWERTIVREFFDHFVSRATHLLDLAVSQNEDPKVETLRALVEACAWLEMAHRNDKLSSRSIGLWKNLGLGYMNIVRNNESFIPSLDELRHSQSLMEHDINDIWWDDANTSTADWKTWASRRWQFSWNKFLHMDGAELDQSYESVKSIFEAVTQTAFRKKLA